MIFESATNLNKTNTEYFKLFVHISRIGPEVVNYTVDKRIIARFMFYEYNVDLHMKDVKYQELENNFIGF